MVASLGTLYQFWKAGRTAYRLSKLKDGATAKVLALSDEVDGLIPKYKAAKMMNSTELKDKIKKRLGEIKSELYALQAVNYRVKIGSQAAVAEDGAMLMLEIQAANVSRSELFRIWWEQSEGRLPFDEGKPDWRKRREWMERHRRALFEIAVTANKLIKSQQKEAVEAQGRQEHIRDVQGEVRKLNAADTVQQIKMLEDDYNRALADEEDAGQWMQSARSVEKWATQQHDKYQEAIEVGDQVYARQN